MNDSLRDITKLMTEMLPVFDQKPILIGGKAMEYYGLRKAGADIDLVIGNDDYKRLETQYPEQRKDLYGDLGVVLWPFEIWRSIALLDYDFYQENAAEYDLLKVVSLDRLLFMRVIAREVEKYNADLDLMVDYYYTQFRNKEFLSNYETHIASYQKQKGVVFGGEYKD